MWVSSSLATVKTPTIIALGNFDGIHRGHQQVIQAIGTDRRSQTIAEATHESNSPVPYPTVVTFDPHPQAFFSGQSRPLLTPLAEKQRYLTALGVQQLVLLPFDRKLACLSPQAFVQEILIQQLQIQAISVGFNFRFGHRRQGSATDLVAIAAAHGVPVKIIAPQQCETGERISSSSIRQALTTGDLPRAHRLLGRPYCLRGSVVAGEQLGRTLGFPTANLQLPPDKFLPGLGVYAVWVGSEVLTQPQPGVMNLGYRPTVEGRYLSVEVHLLDWSGDLYGHTLTVQLANFLRPEQPFPNLEALRTQIDQDCKVARSLVGIS